MTYRPIQARFHFGSDYTCLNLATYTNSLVRSTKSTQSPLRAPTLWKHKVSGSISLPSRGSFHLSLTVLVRYRSWMLFSLGRWSSQLQSGFLVSEPTQEIIHILYWYFKVRDFHPLWLSFPAYSSNKNILYPGLIASLNIFPTTP